MRIRSSRWWLRLGLICVVALAIRVAYVLLLRDPGRISFDAFEYHRGANLLVKGKAFIDAALYDKSGVVHQRAHHPPLYLIALALPSALGAGTLLDHELWSCVMGVGTVASVGLLGRHLGGPRAGLIAAFLAAIYPNIWVSDGLVMSETLALLVTTLVLLALYRLLDLPSPGRALVVGAALGAAALTRGEDLLLLVLVVAGLLFVARRHPGPWRGAALVVASAALATMSPWVAFNLVRFTHPVIIVTSFDQALFQANCDLTYYGSDIGRYSFSCPDPPAADLAQTRDSTDETIQTRPYRDTALRYIGSHWSRLPLVVLARVGRAAGVYRPVQQARVDSSSYDDLRDPKVTGLGLAFYYLLAPAAVVGALRLRRQGGVALWPLGAVVVTSVASVAATAGLTRYRASVEIVIVVLAAVAAERFVSVGNATGEDQVGAGEPSLSDATVA